MQTRTKREISFEAEGDEKPGPIMSFQLVMDIYQQGRRNDREVWSGRSASTRTVLAKNITRHGMTEILNSGADWLAYIEGDI